MFFKTLFNAFFTHWWRPQGQVGPSVFNCRTLESMASGVLLIFIGQWLPHCVRPDRKRKGVRLWKRGAGSWNEICKGRDDDSRKLMLGLRCVDTLEEATSVLRDQFLLPFQVGKLWLATIPHSCISLACDNLAMSRYYIDATQMDTVHVCSRWLEFNFHIPVRPLDTVNR